MSSSSCVGVGLGLETCHGVVAVALLLEHIEHCCRSCICTVEDSMVGRALSGLLTVSQADIGSTGSGALQPRSTYHADLALVSSFVS